MIDKDLLNFNMGTILGSNTDSGGYTYFYLNNHNAEGIPIDMFYLYSISSNDYDLKYQFNKRCPFLFNSMEWSSHFFVCPDTFLHIRMGSNWSKHPRYADMIAEVNLFFSELLNSSNH